MLAMMKPCLSQHDYNFVTRAQGLTSASSPSLPFFLHRYKVTIEIQEEKASKRQQSDIQSGRGAKNKPQGTDNVHTGLISLVSRGEGSRAAQLLSPFERCPGVTHAWDIATSKLKVSGSLLQFIELLPSQAIQWKKKESNYIYTQDKLRGTFH
ncbi:hypothetical protein H109_02154 [Trichophyton interdigitale MR816]|uniref:Uncharacterized protein n=1 Tax=Trichophyton interdigitale (strain MR816) TaxID=1215338 RepID=A0A059JDW8_TRIIM|nr:hypothetical protein H109_02154 [Trichophyton interdigitale MR816]